MAHLTDLYAYLRRASDNRRSWLPLLLLMLLVSARLPGHAATPSDLEGRIQALFPKATRIGAVESDYPVRPVYQLQELLGYVFESKDLSDLPGFSGKPINLLIGIDTEGRFQGVQVLEHHEPVFLHGLGMAPLLDFIGQYVDRRVSEQIIVDSARAADQGASADGPVYFDGVTKATVSVIIVNDTVLSTALQVARRKLEGFAQGPAARPKTDLFQPMNWQQLLSAGYLKHWQLSAVEVEQRIGGSLAVYPELDLEGWNEDHESDTPLFSELYYAYLNAPIIGRNLLGEPGFRRLQESLKQDEQAFLVLSRGPYPHVPESFKPGTVPGRLGLTQNKLSIELRDLNLLNDGELRLPADLPPFDQAHIFRIKGHAGFDPGREISLKLNVTLNRNPLIRDSGQLSDSYTLSQDLFEVVEPAPQTTAARRPIWVGVWESRMFEVLILVAGLGVLTWAFLKQRKLSRSARLTHRFRWAYLGFTILFVGVYAQGQLSVVNVFTLLLALAEGFDIRIFLLDPILFILWSFTFTSLFLWGRGLYCGWLCPFGALQELLSRVAKRLHLRQWRVPLAWHRKLILLKYPILGGLVLIAFESMTLAQTLSEVEPFKTSFTLFFVRSWPFVVYALLVLGVGLFIHKFYCRYLCPLGAGLAVLGRLRLFSWLNRIDTCGKPCQVCHNRCEIDAIHRDGRIDYDECVQCLECVVILNSADQCPAERIEEKARRRRDRLIASDQALT